MEVKVHNHGFVRLVDHMGGDGAIVQAARVSYGEGTKTVREDTDLIRFLMRNQHFSPFAMCQVKFHIKLPIFVHRQWIRHDRFHWNEVSARYSVLPEEMFVPETWRIQSKSNRQQSEGKLEGSIDDLDEKPRAILMSLGFAPEESISDAATALATETIHSAYLVYESLLNAGVPREQARIVLNLAQYTECYVTANLGDWMLFLKQRLSPHAQAEIRDYAEAVHSILRTLFPAAMEAFTDYQLHARTFSSTERQVLRELAGGLMWENEEQRKEYFDQLNLSRRERAELLRDLGLIE